MKLKSMKESYDAGVTDEFIKPIVMVDDNGNGIRDCDDIPGCTNSLACNYNANATADDGSCIVPTVDCDSCNATNDGLVKIDVDGDGICDLNDDTGCTNSAACNYNKYAPSLSHF